MHAIAHRSRTNTVFKESALEIDSGRRDEKEKEKKKTYRIRESNPSQHCVWLFGSILCQLSCTWEQNFTNTRRIKKTFAAALWRPCLYWNSSILEPVYIGTCLFWNLSVLELVSIGPCLCCNLFLFELVYIGTCLYWNLSILDIVYIGLCLYWTPEPRSVSPAIGNRSAGTRILASGYKNNRYIKGILVQHCLVRLTFCGRKAPWQMKAHQPELRNCVKV